MTRQTLLGIGSFSVNDAHRRTFGHPVFVVARAGQQNPVSGALDHSRDARLIACQRICEKVVRKLRESAATVVTIRRHSPATTSAADQIFPAIPIEAKPGNCRSEL